MSKREPVGHRLPLLEIARVLLPAIRSIQGGGYEAALGPAALIPLWLDRPFEWMTSADFAAKYLGD